MSFGYKEMEEEMKRESRLRLEELTYEEHKGNAIDVHPLLNPESSHYSMFDGVEAIKRMEQMYAIEDLMAWAKINAMKYRLRIAKKNIIGNTDESILSDAKKIISYENYYKYLESIG